MQKNINSIHKYLDIFLGQLVKNVKVSEKFIKKAAITDELEILEINPFYLRFKLEDKYYFKLSHLNLEKSKDILLK